MTKLRTFNKKVLMGLSKVQSPNRVLTFNGKRCDAQNPIKSSQVIGNHHTHLVWSSLMYVHAMIGSYHHKTERKKNFGIESTSRLEYLLTVIVCWSPSLHFSLRSFSSSKLLTQLGLGFRSLGGRGF